MNYLTGDIEHILHTVYIYIYTYIYYILYTWFISYGCFLVSSWASSKYSSAGGNMTTGYHRPASRSSFQFCLMVSCFSPTLIVARNFVGGKHPAM